MELVDIPERDGDDGAAQLVTLRAFIKDTDNAAYRIPDTLLIDYLVQQPKEDVWRELVKAPEKSIPWSYDTSAVGNHITLIRTLTNDIVESTAKRTDYELIQYLSFLPLKYLVSSLNAYISDSYSYPNDLSDPLRIMRDLLDDTECLEYTDIQLIDAMLDNSHDPYTVVINKVLVSVTVKASLEAESGGGGLASIDGISFTNSAKDDPQASTTDNLDVIRSRLNGSVYYKDDLFGWYIDNESNLDAMESWYAI